jgi:thioredoxin-related protein
MKTRHLVLLFFLAGCCIAGAQTNSITSATNQTKRPDIYDESADGSKQIAEAVETATKEHKRVLLMFGANWCGWCHKLHTLFETNKDIADELKNNYVIAMIDVNKEHNADLYSKYRQDSFGIPFLVVLDSDGKYLLTQHTAVLEEGDHHSPQKVMTFLKEWAPKP